MFRNFALLLLVAAIVSLGACDTDREGVLAPLGSSTITVGAVEMTLFTDRTVYEVTDLVTMQIRITNVGGDLLAVDTGNVDFEVTTPSGDVVFGRAADGTPPDPPSFVGSLATDEATLEEFVWNQGDAAGNIVQAGFFLVRGTYSAPGEPTITRTLQIELI